MLLKQPLFAFMLLRADMFSRQWSAKFAWFPRRIIGEKFCDPLVNFFAGKNLRVEKAYQRALTHARFEFSLRGFGAGEATLSLLLA